MASSNPVFIEMSVKASDESFESTLRFPVTANPKQIEAMFLGWMKSLEAAIVLPTTAGSTPEPAKAASAGTMTI